MSVDKEKNNLNISIMPYICKMLIIYKSKYLLQYSCTWYVKNKWKNNKQWNKNLETKWILFLGEKK